MFEKILLSATSFAFVLSAAFAPLSSYADGRDEAGLVKTLKNYEKTGKIENCVRLRNVDKSRVIDDYNIIFFMRGKKAYLNTLNHRCSRLGVDGNFSYSVSHFQLCDYDVIAVFDAHGQAAGGFCGLSKFVEYEKKPETEKQITQP